MTRMVAKLEQEMNNRDEVVRLQNELHYREQEITNLELESKTLRRIQDRKDAELVRLSKQQGDDGPFSYRTWKGERDTLKAEIARLRASQQQQRRTEQAQQARIQELQARLNTLASALGDLAPSGSMDVGLNLTLGLGEGPPASPGSGVQSPARGNMRTDGETVPVALYHTLERDLLRMRRVLRDKESAIAERTDMIEVLEKRIEVVSRAKATESKRSRVQQVRQAEEVLVLKQKCKQEADASKERETALKAEIFKLKHRVHQLQQSRDLEGVRFIDSPHKPAVSPPPAAAHRRSYSTRTPTRRAAGSVLTPPTTPTGVGRPPRTPKAALSATGTATGTPGKGTPLPLTPLPLPPSRLPKPAFSPKPARPAQSIKQQNQPEPEPELVPAPEPVSPPMTAPEKEEEAETPEVHEDEEVALTGSPASGRSMGELVLSTLRGEEVEVEAAVVGGESVPAWVSPLPPHKVHPRILDPTLGEDEADTPLLPFDVEKDLVITEELRAPIEENPETTMAGLVQAALS
eukprot:gnl/Trimastix_PCT/713.p1 GENE.gnl/Trimastix_PCT/713~~gnl/Trimastix_PCT/713.p1  ORF type:complete len:520 (+),score=195.08 gnl/Trimastix_PCT/713:446-2005(+)